MSPQPMRQMEPPEDLDAEAETLTDAIARATWALPKLLAELRASIDDPA